MKLLEKNANLNPSLQGHTYLNKPVAETWKLIYVCVTF